MGKRYCLALDLKEDPALIAEYREYHKNVWPEILGSIKDAGIRDMEIHLVENRLFMIMEVDDGFSFEGKAERDLANNKVQEWEALMWKYQKPLPMSRPGTKWRLMERIFKLDGSLTGVL